MIRKTRVTSAIGFSTSWALLGDHHNEQYIVLLGYNVTLTDGEMLV